MSLRESLSSYWQKFQGELFPFLEETVGFLTEPHRTLVTVVDMARLEAFVPHWHGLPGRPLAERAALARAFVAKAVLDLPTTRMLIERVQADKTLRRLCGWSRPCEVPSEFDVLARLRRIRRERAALARARSLDPADPCGPAGRSHRARFDGDRRP